MYIKIVLFQMYSNREDLKTRNIFDLDTKKMFQIHLLFIEIYFRNICVLNGPRALYRLMTMFI